MTRVTWHATATPLQPAQRLGSALGFAPGCLWIKRDDLTGLAGGGNKARKLEYLCTDALEQRCDTLLTGGAAQSNHVRMTAAAAAALGLRCVAVLFGSPPSKVEGNLILDQLFDTEIVWAGTDRPVDALARTATRLTSSGAKVYEIPLGGSSAVGALGYVACADELAAQAPSRAVIVCADGSGGTHAGLVAGFGDHQRVLGVNVGFSELAATVAQLAADTAVAAGRAHPKGELWLDPGQPEPYGAATEATREAVELAARFEGLVLDPVYTGRAMAALIARRRDNRLANDQPVVFLHTGGMPALFTDRYQAWFPVPRRYVVLRTLTPADSTWAQVTLTRGVGSLSTLRLGQRVEPLSGAGLMALDGSRGVGLVTYVLDGRQAELTAVVAVERRQGIGSALLDGLRERLAAAGIERVWAAISNDDVAAFAFLQRNGFRLAALHPGSLNVARDADPTLPLLGQQAIPRYGELVLEQLL